MPDDFDDPEQYGDADDPDVALGPDGSDELNEPGDPDEPDERDERDERDVPDELEDSDEPEELAEPDVPDQPDEPADADVVEALDDTDETDRPAAPDKPDGDAEPDGAAGPDEVEPAGGTDAGAESEADALVSRLEHRLLIEKAERHEMQRSAEREIRALEGANHDLETRLTERTEELRRELAAATMASHAQERFLLELGRNVTGPLRAVAGLIERIDASAVEATERDRLADAKDQLHDLSALLYGLVELAAADEAPRPEDTVERIPSSWLDEFVSTWTRQAARRGQVLVPSVSGLRDPVVLDWPHRRIADALLGNVIVHAVAGGVSIDLSVELGQVALIVSDAGPGLSEAELATAVEPFVGHGATAGVGIGLAVADRLAVRGGGSLTLSGDDPPATTAAIALPRAR